MDIYISIFMYLGLMKLDFDMTGIVLFPFVFFEIVQMEVSNKSGVVQPRSHCLF